MLFSDVLETTNEEGDEETGPLWMPHSSVLAGPNKHNPSGEAFNLFDVIIGIPKIQNISNPYELHPHRVLTRIYFRDRKGFLHCSSEITVPTYLK